MGLLLSCQSIAKSFGGRYLFQELSLSVFEGDRIGLIGLNGSGKSTLLKILAGHERPDAGSVAPRRDLKIGFVPQDCNFPDQKIEQILQEAVSNEIPDYEKERLAETWLSKLGFSDGSVHATALSGGWKKRLWIAREMIGSPDLLLLDEPTNHLDLEGVFWLEKFLLREAPTVLLVSHDRYFLQNTTTRIFEIDPVYEKGVFSIDGSYSHFLQKKEEFMQGQLQKERSVASKARRETEWLRQGVKARTTKSQSRIDEAHEILETYADLQKRNTQKRTKIDFSASERETQKLLVARNIAKSIDSRLLFHHLDLTLSPGSRIGLMGPNGSGKTTLLRILEGEIAPDMGTIKRADDLKTVYFDQHRARLPLDISLREALSPKGDYVFFRGQPIHVNGWCKRFLFSPDLLELPIGKLSGGERARIAIAHLMLQPADLLLLDEPTNDLDIPTLETLEESLLEFPGALVLITHDRCMLDRICTAVLAVGDTETPEIFADFAQWEVAREKRKLPPPVKEKGPEAPPRPKTSLSYKEKKEFDGMEERLAKLESEAKDFTLLMADPRIAEDAARLTEVCKGAALVENQIEQLYLRWEELDKKLRGESL